MDNEVNTIKSQWIQPTWAKNALAKIKELDIKYLELLDIFDVKTVGSVGHYLKGRSEPRIDSLPRLAAKLNLSMDELFYDETSNSPIKFEDKSESYLTKALTILIRSSECSDGDFKTFFSLYEEMGAKNIIQATNQLTEAGMDFDAQFKAILSIQDTFQKTC